MREQLYKNDAPSVDTDRILSSMKKNNVPHAWEHTDVPAPTRHGRSFTVVFFFGALAFFVVAAAVSAYLLFSGGRSISTDHVAITLQGPTTVSGGDTVPLSILIENQNPTVIQGATLTIDFPDGTRSAENVLTPFTRYSDELGDIPSGGRMERSVKAVIFGAENQAISIPVTVQYHITGSTAEFVKTVNYKLMVSTSPLSISIDALSQVVSGQPFSFKVSVHSNATTPLSNVVLAAGSENALGYPFGFVAATSSVAASGFLYKLGTVAPGEHRDVTIRGTLTGTDGDSKVFHFTIGTLSDPNATDIGVAYTTQEATVNITKPFLATTLALNQSNAEPTIIGAGTPVTGTLTWTNTLATSIQDGEIDVTLSGAALDPSSIVTQNGFYRSSDNTIVFDRDTDSALRSIDPGATGTETFTFAAKPSGAIVGLRNPVITLSLSMSGRRVNESQVPENVTASLVRTAQVASNLAFTSAAVRTAGPFGNSGPLPPVPGSVSTYTIQLAVRNTVNSIANGSVTFELPNWVTYAGVVSPGDGSLVYNDVTHTFTWKLGDLAPAASRATSFQISFTPSTSQSGTSPVLIGPQTLSGYDRFVKQNISVTAPAVTIQTVTDPAYKTGDGKVQ